MRRARRACLCVSGVLLICACGPEQTRLESDLTRSDSPPIALPSDPGQLAAMLAVPADSLHAAGEERYFRQEFDSASAIWRVELSRAQSRKDSAAEARVHMWLGLAAYRLGDYATSRREGEMSLALKRQAGLDGELSRSFNALGLLAWNEGRHRDALTAFDSAITSARRHGDQAGVARATGNIPLVKVELGDFDGARRNFETAAALGKMIDDDRLRGNSLANLAMLEIRLGNAQKALPLLSVARRLYKQIEYAPGESNALGQLATAQSAMGDLQSALASADSGLRISRSQGLQQETASTLEVVADLQAQAGNLRLALRNLREADSLDKELGLAVERGTNLRRMSLMLLALGEVPAAVASARDALTAHASVEARGEIVFDRIQLAEALARNGDPRAARAQSDSALRDARRINNPSAIREASAVAARLALNAGDPKRALDQLSSDNIGEQSDWRLLDLQSEALVSLGRLDQAEKTAKKSIAALERERASLAAGPLRSGYLANRTAPFARLVAIHIARHDTAAAFEVAAVVPGRTLTERLAGVSMGNGGLSSVAEGERLLRRVAAVETEIGKLDSVSGRAEQRTALQRALESARAAFEEHLSASGRTLKQGSFTLSPMSLRDVQARLAPDEAVVTYLSGPERLDCFVVRQRRMYYWNSRAGDHELSQRVRVVRDAVTSSSRRGPAPTALSQTYDLLIQPAVEAGALVGVARIVVVPHGALGALPFAALWNRRTGRYLIEAYELSYLPSVNAIAIESRLPSRESSRFAVFAPFPDSLPGTAAEARAVSRLEPNAIMHIGKGARERDARSAIAEGLSIHIASHGSHNSQNPLFSRVSVGRARAGGPSDDGRLEVHEILGMTTTSRLIFLSGCETGLGSAGDGPFAQVSEEGSLSQAFLIAGARHVVATLWRVNDAAAVRIAGSFYRHLRTGLTAERALAMAQKEEIAKRGGFTWAAYSISGNPQIGELSP